MESSVSLFDYDQDLNFDIQSMDSLNICHPIVSYNRRMSDFIIDLYAPGFYKDDLNLKILDDMFLCISGKSKYSSLYFIRNIKLPSDIDRNSLCYDMKNRHIKVSFQTLY